MKKWLDGLLLPSGKDRHEEFQELFQKWRDYNVGPFFLMIAPGMAGIMATVALVNYLLRGGLYRETFIISSLFLLAGFSILALWWKCRFAVDESVLRTRVCLTLSFLIYTSITILGNLVSGPTADVYGMSILFTTVVSIWVLYKFVLEWYVYSVIASVETLLLAIFRPQFWHLMVFTLLMIYIMMILTFILRRRFCFELHQRYVTLRGLVPTRVARHITVSGERSLADAFAPRHAFVVCLSSDWRGFQRLASTLPAHEIALLIKTYYHQVFIKLAATVPDETYFADWTADELFVIFYGQAETAEARTKLMDEALDFAYRLATEIPSEVEREAKRRLVFDIGLAAGEGLLGLLGPPERMKTTLAAEVAGVAARLQSEAKRLRRQGYDTRAVPAPLLVMDAGMRARASCDARFDGIQAFCAEEKDVAGGDYYLWKHS